MGNNKMNKPMKHLFLSALSCSILIMGCTPTIKIEAPDKPIRLHVEINIKQEILLKVEKEVDQVSSAPAIPLAKKAGWIGERLDGYLGLVKINAPVDIQELVSKANEEREVRYSSIAKKHNTKRQMIETVAGRKFTAKSDMGEYIKNESGNWVQK